MRQSIFICLLLLGLWATSSPCHGQKGIGSRAKSDLKKQLTKYQRAKNEEARATAEIGVFRHGKKGLEFLASLPLKEEQQKALARLQAASELALGLDILKSGESTKKSQWAKSYISFGEIVLLKKPNVFSGFLIHETPEAASGTLTYSWWKQVGPAKKLNQAGGTKGERITVKGKKAAKPIKVNAGYDEFDYELSVGDQKVTVHFIGPAYFLVDALTIPPFCFTASNKPSKFSNSDTKIKYVRGDNGALAKLEKQLPKYVFRTVPGTEPLNIAEEDQGAFAQYESVQVEIRRTRITSSLIVLIRFAEPDAITFEDHMPIYIANFIREIIPIDDANLLIASGAAPSYEANKYWSKGKWVAAKGSIKKFLRTNFPEDY